MSTNVDYQAMLADMEAKRAALDLSIEHLRVFLGMSPGSSDAVQRTASAGPPTSNSASELPKGALLNKSIPEAIKLYLKSVVAKRTTREITEALQAHGVATLSSNFFGIVFTALKRLKASQEVLQFDDGWGLAEFYPAHIRAAMTNSSKTGSKANTKAKTKPKAKAKKNTSTAPKTSKPATPTTAPLFTDEPVEEGIEPRVERYIAGLQYPMLGIEIAGAMNVKSQTIALLLAKLASKGRITKTADGKYGPNPKVHEMHRAS